ncbi:MAG: tRNA (cytidine(34)-2'-O)-methyltransferase [Rickettsiales bacterium]|nr:tRNA (cytidine(34)-2'-O)-methyltransferase [Pseudomonadota bacterium]MDA0966969.1 tRNA (cytidine(34)-2'-O)-methyltransferase [Pseudomonadota bacterium]MDG4543888.1 tRNA (cytidine(34)-2'-O)-methyltransferase [Rickettsiales bacterium]MDG4546034.1 tRNA (cytidine(34)-2'-O)-methyltransferase [Rickettsiales bacterium]MDG4548280.1 tRNA (cytidine(34)-2'-O)-methyltransferase [Rickettsiales bacterium]
MKIALYQPDIAQNLGTNLRTAACLGVDVEIIEPCGFPFDDRKVRRAGMDYMDMVKYTRHNSWDDFKKWTQENDYRIVLLSSKADTPYTEFSFRENDILLLGRESAGVPPEVTSYCKNAVTITMTKGVRSLNVAVSVGIVLGEALRQVRSL